MEKSRIVARNLRWALIYQIITLLLGFISPRFIVLTYGSEVNGLQSSIMQILNILSLLQAGAVSASVYLLFKPLSQGDYETVSRYLYSTIKYFKRIAYMFFIITAISAGVFATSVKGSISKPEIFTSFLILGFKTALDLYFCSRYITIYTADQCKHYISIARLLEKIVYYSLFYIAIIFKQYFIWLYIYLVISCVVKIVYYQFVFSKKYSGLIDLKKKYEYVPIKGKNYSMINEISHSVVVSSISIILSFLYGLQETSVFSVYNLVFTMLSMIGIVIFDSFAASFGHLSAEGDYSRINSVFRIFTTGFNMINTILYITAAFLIIPFAKLYTQGMTDAEYINPLLGLMIVLFGICYTYRIPYNIVVSANGLFSETGIQPFVFMFVSIICSIVFGIIRMELVLAGPVIFYISNFIYQKIKLQRLLPKLNLKGKWDQIIISLVGVILASLISIKLQIISGGFVSFIISGVLCIIISSIYTIGLYSINNKQQIIDILFYAKSFVKRGNNG